MPPARRYASTVRLVCRARRESGLPTPDSSSRLRRSRCSIGERCSVGWPLTGPRIVRAYARCSGERQGTEEPGVVRVPEAVDRLPAGYGGAHEGDQLRLVGHHVIDLVVEVAELAAAGGRQQAGLDAAAEWLGRASVDRTRPQKRLVGKAL